MYPYSPYGYQPYQMQNNIPIQQSPAQNLYQQQQTQQNSDERIWVQGEEAAKAYLVAPNGFVRLWDAMSPVFYEKKTDSTGRPYMETYTYEKRSEMPPVMVQKTKSEEEYTAKLKALEDRISALERSINEPSTDGTAVSPV